MVCRIHGEVNIKMRTFNYMFLLGLVILAFGILLVSYVEDHSYSYQDGAPWYTWHNVEVKTKPYFTQGIVIISMGLCLIVVWLFWWRT
jgi:hypothetical protein